MVNSMGTRDLKSLLKIGIFGTTLVACSGPSAPGRPQEPISTSGTNAESGSPRERSRTAGIACMVKEIEWAKNKNGDCVVRYALAVVAQRDEEVAVHVESEPNCGYNKLLGYICDSKHETDCVSSPWSCCRSSGIQTSVDLVVGRRPRVVFFSVHVPKQLGSACGGYEYQDEDHVPSSRMSLTLGYIPANRFKSPGIWPTGNETQRTIDAPDDQNFALCWQEG